jgi:hypothetical protein
MNNSKNRCAIVAFLCSFIICWSAAQDARARKYLDSLPQRAPIFNQLFRDISAASSSYMQLSQK